MIDFTDAPFLAATKSTEKEKKEEDSSSIGAGAGGRRPSEKKKRVKMADLRALIETRILSKSDRGLEKIGIDGTGNGNGKTLHHTVR